MSKQEKRAEVLEAKREELQEQIKALKEKAFFHETPKLLDKIKVHEAKLSALDTEARSLQAEIREVEASAEAEQKEADRELRARLPGEAAQWIKAEGEAEAYLFEAFGVLQGLVERWQELEDAGDEARNKYWTSLNALSNAHRELPDDLDALRKSRLIAGMETGAAKKAGLPIPKQAAEIQRFRFFGETLKKAWWTWRRDLFPDAKDRPKTTIKM